jgi:hypothetical protein
VHGIDDRITYQVEMVYARKFIGKDILNDIAGGTATPATWSYRLDLDPARRQTGGRSQRVLDSAQGCARLPGRDSNNSNGIWIPVSGEHLGVGNVTCHGMIGGTINSTDHQEAITRFSSA